MVTPKEATAVRKGLTDGTVNIVIGTHALLAKTVKFADLGLLIVDEEQHFGVAHKEKLKALREDVHVLTLSATPLPRTLQLALTGVREMSLIATPPTDRLAVRTFIMPFDSVVIREAIQRERFRGGQVFCVVPRIEDLDRMATRLHEIVPDARLVQAHGRLTPTELERVMTEFSDGKYDILLSTNIVESGLDMPAVNTLIIHRATCSGWDSCTSCVGAWAVASNAAMPTLRGRRHMCSRLRRRSGWKSCRHWIRWARASRWLLTTLTCVVRATCWAMSSRAISVK